MTVKLVFYNKKITKQKYQRTQYYTSSKHGWL